MTQREFYTKIVEANVNEEITKKANELLEAMNERNAKKASTQTKTQKENETLKNEMLKSLEQGKNYLASEIGEVMGFSTSKASALAKQLVNEGKATVADVKVKGKGTQKSYTILAESVENNAEIDE